MAETQTYPTIKFFLRHGDTFAWVLGLLVVVYGVWGTYAGGNWACVVTSFPAGWFVFMLVRCLREVLHLVADTLMPL